MKNWGLLRCTLPFNISSPSPWGSNTPTASPTVTATASVPASGKNVDVVIVDSIAYPDHPEFDTRYVQYNWFQHNPEVTGGAPGTYLYDSYTGSNNHATHTSGTAAGNTQGWAREANIYNLRFSSAYTNVQYLIDYVKAFHRNKPINPETGEPTNDWPPIGVTTIGAYKYKNFFLRFRHLTSNHPSFPLTTLELIELRGPSVAQPNSDTNGYYLFGYGYNPLGSSVLTWPDLAPPWSGVANGSQPSITGAANFLAHCAYKAGITTDFGWDTAGNLKSGWSLLCRSDTATNTPVTITGLQQTLVPGLNPNGEITTDSPGQSKYHDFTLSFRLSGTDPSPVYFQPMVTKVQMPNTPVIVGPSTEYEFLYQLGTRTQVN
jgi:hypothetical protein